jgi:hypothetical protein
MLAIIAIERAVSHGVAKQKAAEIIKKVGEMEQVIDEAVNRFSEHANDSDRHITPTLLELFKERNDYVKSEWKQAADAQQNVIWTITRKTCFGRRKKSRQT